MRVQTLQKQNKGNYKFLGNYRSEYFRKRLFDNTDIGFGQVLSSFSVNSGEKEEGKKESIPIFQGKYLGS